MSRSKRGAAEYLNEGQLAPQLGNVIALSLKDSFGGAVSAKLALQGLNTLSGVPRKVVNF